MFKELRHMFRFFCDCCTLEGVEVNTVKWTAEHSNTGSVCDWLDYASFFSISLFFALLVSFICSSCSRYPKTHSDLKWLVQCENSEVSSRFKHFLRSNTRPSWMMEIQTFNKKQNQMFDSNLNNGRKYYTHIFITVIFFLYRQSLFRG